MTRHDEKVYNERRYNKIKELEYADWEYGNVRPPIWRDWQGVS